MSVATLTLIKVKIFVDDITAILADFNQIEVWRSVDPAGPWEPVAVAGGPVAAEITADDRWAPFHLSGKDLKLRFNGVTEITVPFPGPDPYPLATVVTDVNTAIGVLGTGSATADGHLKVVTAATGNGASIEVTGGYYPDVGFQYLETGLGNDAPIPLVVGQQDYVCEDHNGHTYYWYRTRYRNSVSAATSEYSVPFPASAVQKLPSSDLITGTCHLVDLQGNGLVGQRIVIHNLMEPSVRSGYGIFGVDAHLTTDDDGYGSVVLVRGSLVEVAFVNTPVRRRIRVPTDPLLAEFDFLDQTLAQDEFGIHLNEIQLAARLFP